MGSWRKASFDIFLAFPVNPYSLFDIKDGIDRYDVSNVASNIEESFVYPVDLNMTKTL